MHVQALSQPVPGSCDDPMAEAAASVQASLGQTGALPAMAAVSPLPHFLSGSWQIPELLWSCPTVSHLLVRYHTPVLFLEPAEAMPHEMPT